MYDEPLYYPGSPPSRARKENFFFLCRAVESVGIEFGPSWVCAGQPPRVGVQARRSSSAHPACTGKGREL